MVLNVYKPQNWTSFDVVAKVRAILREKRGVKNIKVGHAGTLDPLAEGALIVLTDEDTKKQQEFIKLSKEYLAKIAFGAESETYDLEGTLRFATSLPSHKKIQEKLALLLPKYIGEITQTVPPYSAVKVAGKKLYTRARKDNLSEIELPTKKVTIYSIKTLDFKEETVQKHKLPVLTCSVTCSSGTYVRSLAHDLGADLKTGAVLVALARTRIGDFTIESAIKIEELKKIL